MRSAFRPLCLVGMAFVALAASSALTDGLTLYLACDEGEGTLLSDASPTRAVVTAHGNIAWTPSAGFGNALDFRKDSDAYLETTHDFGTPTELTLAFRAYVEDGDPSRSNYFLDTRAEDFGELDGAFYLSRHREGYVQMVNPTTRLPSEAYPRKEWFHLAVVADAKSVQFFVDGKRVAEGDPVSLNIGNRLVFGNRHSRDQAIIGVLDEIALWKRKLSAEEINQAKNQPLPVTRAVSSRGKLAVRWANLRGYLRHAAVQ